MTKLKNVMDRNEGFMGAHQIVKARTYKRKSPLWTNSQRAIRSTLLRAFPKMETDERQREAAGRWASVIHLYFRMNYTVSQVAHEIGSTQTKVEFVIRSIYRVSKGLRANGSGPLTGKRGRPRKKRAV